MTAQQIVADLVPKPCAASTQAGCRGIRPHTSLTVDFATASTDLTDTSRRTLNELGSALASPVLGAYRLSVEGHTDTVGSVAFNRTLSERRAERVVAYLVDRFRIEPARLAAVGRGESGLLVPTPDQTPEPQNRRVELINVGTVDDAR